MSKSIAEMTGDSSSPYRVLMEAVSAAIRVAMPGKIISFDPLTQTAQVKPMLADKIQLVGAEQYVWPPVLPDVPVLFPRGGDFAITLPVAAGDACLLIFADSCIDGFMQTGAETAPAELRRHDMSDALAIVGLSAGEPLKDYHAGALQIRSLTGTSKITMSADSITINAETITIAEVEKEEEDDNAVSST